MHNIYDFVVTDIYGQQIPLSNFKNKVLLIVNVASKCGHTKQYEELEKLYLKYKDDGFVVLGFPCNQFLKQEPNENDEILKFCQLNFNVTFPMFSKICVNGENAIALYNYLKETLPWTEKAKSVKWNFEKFLINRNGIPVKRFLSKTTPFECENEILNLLKE